MISLTRNRYKQYRIDKIRTQSDSIVFHLYGKPYGWFRDWEFITCTNFETEAEEAARKEAGRCRISSYYLDKRGIAIYDYW